MNLLQIMPTTVFIFILNIYYDISVKITLKKNLDFPQQTELTYLSKIVIFQFTWDK